jgi:hypothetical protein
MGLRYDISLPPAKEGHEDIDPRMAALQRVIELERDHADGVDDHADVMEEMEFLTKRRIGIEEKLRGVREELYEVREELGNLLGFTCNRHQMPQDGLARPPRVNA